MRFSPGTGARPSSQKLWRVDRTFLFSGLNHEQVLGRVDRNCGEWIALFLFFRLSTSFSIFFTLLTSFSSFSSFYSFFLFSLFCPFSHLFRLFHIISFFSTFFPFFFTFFFAFSLTWPQPCRLTLPSLTLPHITSPLLFFLDRIWKKGASKFSPDFCAENKFLPTKKADHFKVYPYV